MYISIIQEVYGLRRVVWYIYRQTYTNFALSKSMRYFGFNNKNLIIMFRACSCLLFITSWKNTTTSLAFSCKFLPLLRSSFLVHWYITCSWLSGKPDSFFDESCIETLPVSVWLPSSSTSVLQSIWCSYNH